MAWHWIQQIILSATPLLRWSSTHKEYHEHPQALMVSSHDFVYAFIWCQVCIDVCLVGGDAVGNLSQDHTKRQTGGITVNQTGVLRLFETFALLLGSPSSSSWGPSISQARGGRRANRIISPSALVGLKRCDCGCCGWNTLKPPTAK